jgi:hypothetical protein
VAAALYAGRTTETSGMAEDRAGGNGTG